METEVDMDIKETGTIVNFSWVGGAVHFRITENNVFEKNKKWVYSAYNFTGVRVLRF